MTRSSGTQPRRLDRGQTPQGTSRSLRESPFSSIQKGLVPTIFAEEHFSSVSDALGACARALSNERALRTVVLISMSDDFEIVLGRKLTDAFRVQLPEATPILRQTNAHLAEGGHSSPAPRASPSRATARTRMWSAGNPSGCIGIVVFSMNPILRNAGEQLLRSMNTRRDRTW